MRRPGGYLVGVGPEGIVDEADTFTCAHCQRIVRVAPRCDPADMGGRCGVCDSLVCSACVGLGCRPWEKQMETMERRDRFRREFDRAAG
jgi:hypothetical protein